MTAPATSPIACLDALPRGYSEGAYDGRRWSATVKASNDGRRWQLWAEGLGGTERVSANLYLLADGRELLKPCEMPAERVLAFLEGYRWDGARDPRQPAPPPR